MPAPAYIVGIDLGTTHCAAAFVEAAGGDGARAADFLIPQLARAGEIVEAPLLPSCLYVAGDHELPPGSTRLPWGDSPRLVAGVFARWQGARVPGRQVVSAKSWLCHPGVDRGAAILPWGAPADVARVSPVDASAQFLAHIRAAWDFRRPEAPLADQEVLITVPASFDEAARALTVEAARRAGLERMTLVEEPQAAFYDFISRNRGRLGDILDGVRLALVVDVGGGTTDFTLIQVGPGSDGGAPALQRLAVGDHLMLGGDNMDAALARRVEERLQAGGRRLSAAQWTQLLQAARAAKETLLGDGAPERCGVSIVAEGSRLLSGAISAQIERAEAESLILDGFFPACGSGEEPRRAARTALQEMGLPYAQDPAVTRHLASFLRRHAAAGFAALDAGREGAALPRPDAVLLNGGVFKSPKISGRLVAALSAWWPDAPEVRTLPHDSLESAVARGAALHGLARRGRTGRISGGSAHAVYVGIAPESPGAGARAVCLAPRGQEEGRPVDLDRLPFELVLGRPVQFPLYSTAADRRDAPGAVVDVDDDFRALPPIHTRFQSARRTGRAPVHLRALLTELGALELWCVANDGDERWRLEFDLRGAAARPAAAVTESLPPRFDEARGAVGRVLGPQAAPDASKEAKQLFRTLEKLLGPRSDWRLSTLRELWGALDAGAARRRRSPDHERAFFQLAGFCLRPGFGYPLDDWRCEQTFRLLGEGLKFHGETAHWSEFWVMWRRIAGGLGEARHQALWAEMKPHLALRIPTTPPKEAAKPKGIRPEGLDEMVRTAASLEHLDPAEKNLLGDWIAQRLKSPATAAGPWAWALGRLGARAPLYGSSHKTVEPEKAEEWLGLLLDAGLDRVDGAAFAAAQTARLTGDRTRDLGGDLRARTASALRAAGAPAAWATMVEEIVVLQAEDESRALGDALPMGLKLRA